MTTRNPSDFFTITRSDRPLKKALRMNTDNDSLERLFTTVVEKIATVEAGTENREAAWMKLRAAEVALFEEVLLLYARAACLTKTTFLINLGRNFSVYGSCDRRPGKGARASVSVVRRDVVKPPPSYVDLPLESFVEVAEVFDRAKPGYLTLIDAMQAIRNACDAQINGNGKLTMKRHLDMAEQLEAIHVLAFGAIKGRAK